ncbi:unnamed protein product [Clavelina lepadiformis]|uniref:Uncharacterized protein n=1 Tax=Clavelina lepadiformis TaxID=159417 RepID=A0ABP0GM42_CLALP
MVSDLLMTPPRFNPGDDLSKGPPKPATAQNLPQAAFAINPACRTATRRFAGTFYAVKALGNRCYPEDDDTRPRNEVLVTEQVLERPTIDLLHTSNAQK